MAWLLLGLVIFLGTHSVRIFGDAWRTKTVSSWGDMRWKGAYSLVSIVGFALIIWGYGQARLQPEVLWTPPVAMRHLAALLVWVAFVMITATYVPGNAIKAKLRHPMILSVKVWALAHLLSNGNVADVALFGAFLIWAVLDFRSARQRDRINGITPYPSNVLASVITVLVGTAAWAAFAFWGHRVLIGISPMGT